jgi:cellulose synthase/poly-beta-1,6-N-acetylglucosamine synthase-like glycosyltransferase
MINGIFAAMVAEILFFLCLLAIALYGMFLLRLERGWVVSPTFKGNATSYSIKVSVVVCARDESAHIQRLLTCLAAQSYIYKEIIVVDDGSTDNTADIILTFPDVELVSLSEGVGKKQALKKGIEHATGELIVCTDADCTMGTTWLETLVQCYDRNQPDMIIAPVRMSYNNTLFQRMQAVEFMSLTASTAGAAIIGHPIMCNGANLSFTKKAWSNSSDELMEKFESVDDMFLMESIKRRGGKIVYVKSKKTLVTTTPNTTLYALFQQRSRWVSKSGGYTDQEIQFVATMVVLSTIMPLLLLLTGFFNSHFFLFGLILWVIKSSMDWAFLRLFRSFFAIPLSLSIFLPLAILYPFYLTLSIAIGKMGKVVWK